MHVHSFLCRVTRRLRDENLVMRTVSQQSSLSCTLQVGSLQDNENVMGQELGYFKNKRMCLEKLEEVFPIVLGRLEGLSLGSHDNNECVGGGQ